MNPRVAVLSGKPVVEENLYLYNLHLDEGKRKTSSLVVSQQPAAFQGKLHTF